MNLIVKRRDTFLNETKGYIFVIVCRVFPQYIKNNSFPLATVIGIKSGEVGEEDMFFRSVFLFFKLHTYQLHE